MLLASVLLTLHSVAGAIHSTTMYATVHICRSIQLEISDCFCACICSLRVCV